MTDTLLKGLGSTIQDGCLRKSYDSYFQETGR